MKTKLPLEKPKIIRRPRNPKKFIPDSDSDFAQKAKLFRDNICADPQMYHLTDENAEEICEMVTAYREALVKAIMRGTRTTISIMAKDEARKNAEAVVRKYGRLIRADESISSTEKFNVGVRERPNKLRDRNCPQEQPFVKFVGADPKNPNVHILKWTTEQWTNRTAKPFGAVRLELFAEHVPPGVAIPKKPGELSASSSGGGGRFWYLRSFTTSPMKVEFPAPSAGPDGGPMMIVYWARWADAKGEVGPFSQTIIARVEGWAAAFPGSEAVGINFQTEALMQTA